MLEPNWKQGGTRAKSGWALWGTQRLCALRLVSTKRILTRIPPRKQFDRSEKKTIHAQPFKTKQNQENKAKQSKAKQSCFCIVYVMYLFMLLSLIMFLFLFLFLLLFRVCFCFCFVLVFMCVFVFALSYLLVFWFLFFVSLCFGLFNFILVCFSLFSTLLWFAPFQHLFFSFPPFCAVLICLAPFRIVFFCFQKGGANSGGDVFSAGTKREPLGRAWWVHFPGEPPEKTAGKPGPPVKGTLASPGQNSQPEFSGIVLAETTRFGAAGELLPERSDMFSFGACCRQRQSGMLK